MILKENVGFGSADILLPDFSRVDGTLWSVVACDQYTSEPSYWEKAERMVDGAPSTLRLILPEVWLSQTEERLPLIHEAMQSYLKTVLVEHPDAMIYLERTQSDGRVRRGIVGAMDLDCYDYHKGATSLIRATEGTVLERIPPRVRIRRGAPVELPHAMLLIDDPQRNVIEPLLAKTEELELVYDFDLMLGGGHVRGFLLDKAEQTRILQELSTLITPNAMQERYGDSSLAPLLFAMGDGNHSLASAKAAYEEIKTQIGEEAAARHPARYALAEIVNLHDEALQFEPIYRVVFGCDPCELLDELKQYVAELQGDAETQRMVCVLEGVEEIVTVAHPEQQLTVGTLQSFLDRYQKAHPEVEVDYIHGEKSLRALANRKDAIGFLFDGMRKDELFRTVIYDGALPRKTFSMGHAPDKRYYLECRRIR